MQKINLDTFNGLAAKVTFANRRRSQFVEDMLSLDVNEGLIFFKSEWKLKSSPSTIISNYGKKENKSYSMKSLADGSGWAILRVK